MNKMGHLSYMNMAVVIFSRIVEWINIVTQDSTAYEASKVLKILATERVVISGAEDGN